MKNCQNKNFLKFKMAAGGHIGFKKKPPGLFGRVDRNLKLWGLGYLNQPKNDLPHKISGLRPFWPFDHWTNIHISLPPVCSADIT